MYIAGGLGVCAKASEDVFTPENALATQVWDFHLEYDGQALIPAERRPLRGYR